MVQWTPLIRNQVNFTVPLKQTKKYIPCTPPPVRPIISASGSITDNIGLFVEYHLKHLANKHDSFLQDTPDFLRQIQIFNDEQILPQNAIIVTMDVTSLYTNIPHDEGLQCVRDVLNQSDYSKVLSEYLVRLLELCLQNNIFEFGSQLFRQLIGASMGMHPGPSYANIFMDQKIDQIIRKIINTFEKNSQLYKKVFKTIFR